MYTQTWTINAKIKGNFFLVAHDIIKTTNFIHPNVRKLIIDPEFDNKEKQTGIFNLSIDYIIETKEERAHVQIPADLGRDIFNMYINLLTFLSGSPVRFEGLKFKYNYPGTAKYRQLIPYEELIQMSTPVPLVNKAILSTKLDYKKDRILTWLRKGIEERDIINSLLSLYASLEIISDQFPCDKIMSRKCEKCGHNNEIEPGTRQKVHNLLINIVNYNEEQFKSIWDNTRSKIIHGGINITQEVKSDLENIRNQITLAIIKAMKILLAINPQDPPQETPPNMILGDAVLDLEIDESKNK